MTVLRRIKGEKNAAVSSRTPLVKVLGYFESVSLEHVGVSRSKFDDWNCQL
jgi:hypothetical protein